MRSMRRKRRCLEKPRINMTPMIDMVFLLLTFFVLTFRVFTPEGDFNVQMSLTGQAMPVESTDESVQVRLVADAEGMLSAIQLNGENIENFDILRQRMAAIGLASPDLEVVLFLDDHLRYEYVVKAMTAVSGELHEGQIRRISRNIKFARQK